MNDIAKSMQAVQPNMIERQCGGWLAVTPKELSLRIGVTGQTKADTIARYNLSMRRWVELLYSAKQNEKEI